MNPASGWKQPENKQKSFDVCQISLAIAAQVNTIKK
jgi:hypothetical protein